MAINRFYNPSRGQYISQFVPKQLPAEMLTRGLLAKQTLADKREAEMNTVLGEWTQPSLGWHDTEYVKEWKGKLESFIDEAQGMDKTSPEFQRRYLGLVQGLKRDEGLQKVQASYDLHQQYKSRIEELVKKGAFARAQELEDQYQRAFGIYTQEGGEGFKGRTQLSDPLIREGLDIRQELEKFVDQVGADSYESMKKLSGEDIYYSTKSGGISKNKLRGAMKEQVDLLFDGPVGEQLKARFRASHIPRSDENGKLITQDQYLNSLTPEQREQFEIQENNFVLNTAFGVADTFATSTYSTGLADAMNKKGDLDRESGDATMLSGQLEGYATPGENLTWEQEVANIEQLQKDYQAQIDAYEAGDLDISEENADRLRSAILTMETDKAMIQQDRLDKWQSDVDQFVCLASA